MNNQKEKEESAIQAVISAWMKEGPHPPTHHAAKQRLKKEWPILAKTLDELSKTKP